MFSRLRALLGSRPARIHDWSHMSAAEWPSAIYAIGDIHGCLTELRALEQAIFADAASIEGEKWLVYLGDYLDRGPDSAAVLDHLMTRPPADFRRLCLAGNHEAMALAYLHSPSHTSDWLGFGGLETLYSYGISPAELQKTSARGLEALIRSHVPEEHRRFLEQLLLTVSVPGYIFVHAGLRPGVTIEQQSEQDLLWIRDEFFRAPPWPDLRVVHGHTPGAEVFMSPGRICIDTGAFATGILSAVRLQPSSDVTVLATKERNTSPHRQ